MAADHSTKASAKSPGTGLDKLTMIEIAKRIIVESTAADRITQRTFPMELPAGVGYVANCNVPSKILFYQGHTETTIESALSNLMDDTDKLFSPRKKSSSSIDSEGISKAPTMVSDGSSGFSVGKRVTLILSSRYPTTEIGGNLGTKDGEASKKQGRKTILARINPVVPLVSVGILLYYLNEGAINSSRKINQYYGPSKSRVYLVPSTPAEVTAYRGRLAKVTEVA